MKPNLTLCFEMLLWPESCPCLESKSMGVNSIYFGSYFSALFTFLYFFPTWFAISHMYHFTPSLSVTRKQICFHEHVQSSIRVDMHELVHIQPQGRTQNSSSKTQKKQDYWMDTACCECICISVMTWKCTENSESSSFTWVSHIKWWSCCAAFLLEMHVWRGWSRHVFHLTVITGQIPL